jgi:glycosyltransferase involved in cell wall biosynthesis
MPDFSIIVPCFNDGATLLEAVESVQHEGASEIILVDDGSDDAHTLEVISFLESREVRVIRQENGGLSAARMSGLRAATTPFVVPVDADDRVERVSLRRLSQALDSNPEAAGAFGDYKYFGSTKGVVRRPWAWDPWLICYINAVPGCGAMLRREAILQVGGWELQGGYEDWDLWMSLMQAGFQSLYVRGVTYHYRQRPNRMLSESSQNHAALYGRLVERHPQLFAQRNASWAHSLAPRRLRFGVPVIRAIPGLSESSRHRLARALAAPERAIVRRLYSILGVREK